MPGLHIDWTALEAAFESHAPDTSACLDRVSGEVLVFVRTVDVQIAARVLGEPTRYAPIEPVPSREQYRMMERFIETVTHPPLKEQLNDSIVGRGAFRRFKDAVGRFGEERKRWFAFRDVLLHRHILDWLKVQRIELAEMPAWNLELPVTPTPAALLEESVPAPSSDDVDERVDAGAMRDYLLAWARSHADDYQYLFGPAAFERLADDLQRAFTFHRRRSPP